eukprot:5852771-Pyramimonas_sp.AAC.1
MHSSAPGASRSPLPTAIANSKVVDVGSGTLPAITEAALEAFHPDPDAVSPPRKIAKSGRLVCVSRVAEGTSPAFDITPFTIEDVSEMQGPTVQQPPVQQQPGQLLADQQPPAEQPP